MSRAAFAIAAHPDDIEFVMAGTMMHLKQAGYELHYMTIGNGSCGSAELDATTIARIRRDESRAAANYLGATFHESLCPDIEIFYDRPTLIRLGSIVREVAPEIILTHSPQDYMEDHTNTCRLAVTAAFCRGMPNFPVDPPRHTTEQDVTVYHAQPHGNCDSLCNPIVPEIFVDVTQVIARKAEMLIRHQSQKRWLDLSQGMDSYLHTMRDLSREVGRMSARFQFAEGWRRHLHLGFSRNDADPLVDALRPLGVIADSSDSPDN
jgi:N-acetylglucosamine malate deacetylase 1